MPECDKFLEYPRYLVYPIGQKRLGGGRRIVQKVGLGRGEGVKYLHWATKLPFLDIRIVLANIAHSQV